MAAPISITHLDHLVLTVVDMDATCDFYERVLGMTRETFDAADGPRRVLVFGGQKINLHQVGSEFEPKAALAVPGSADICLITKTPLAEVIGHLRDCAVTVVEGPVARTGAAGKIISVYFRDPDGNLIEVANYV
jgi:catechol 2,3-dioxygenase-like lactoylglutathione lyase family enzyme